LAVHIIEDDFAVCDALSLFLQELGYLVFTYDDAEAFFSAGPPAEDDIVIVDLGLPGLEGRSVINWLQGMAVTPRIIAISGKPKNILEESIRGISDIAVLRKPLSLAELDDHFDPAAMPLVPTVQAQA